jgi:hypothetical protein
MLFMRAFAAILILASVTMAGCATGPSVRVNHNPADNLTAYKTFGFFEHASTDHGAPYTSLMTVRLQQATRTQLERLGYAYDEKSPQLRVNFFANVTDRQELRATGTSFYSYRFYRPWHAYPHDLETLEYKAGTLSIDLVDTKTQSVVWQGLAEGRVSSAAYKQPGPTIDRVVSDIFQKFPQPPSS